MSAAARLDPAVSGTLTLDPIEDAVRAMAAGRPVLVVDNEDRENEGDIIFAAQHATPALMGWTIRYSSGVICVPLDGPRADALALRRRHGSKHRHLGNGPGADCPDHRRSGQRPGHPDAPRAYFSAAGR